MYSEEAKTPSKTRRRCIVKYYQRTGKAPKEFSWENEDFSFVPTVFEVGCVCFCLCLQIALSVANSDSLLFFKTDLNFGCEVSFLGPKCWAVVNQCSLKS